MQLCEKKKKEKKRKEVARGRDVSLGIQGFTVWCEFYSTKKIYIIGEEDIL